MNKSTLFVILLLFGIFVTSYTALGSSLINPFYTSEYKVNYYTEVPNGYISINDYGNKVALEVIDNIPGVNGSIPLINSLYKSAVGVGAALIPGKTGKMINSFLADSIHVVEYNKLLLAGVEFNIIDIDRSLFKVFPQDFNFVGGIPYVNGVNIERFFVIDMNEYNFTSNQLAYIGLNRYLTGIVHVDRCGIGYNEGTQSFWYLGMNENDDFVRIKEMKNANVFYLIRAFRELGVLE